MPELSSPDIFALVAELSKVIAGARIQKVYHKERELHLSIHVPGVGSRILVSGPGMFFMTDARLAHDLKPSPYAMFLRKRLAGKRIEGIAQPGFERIVRLDLDEGFSLFLEVFAKGNIVLTDAEGKIVGILERQEWKDRTLKGGVKYELPPASTDPRTLDLKAFTAIVSKSKKQIVSLLARGLSLGGKYAESLCVGAKIDPKKESKSLSEAQTKLIFKEINRIINNKPKPVVYYEKDKPEEVSLTSLHQEKRVPKTISTFNKAVDTLFVSGMELAEKEEAKSAAGAKKDKILKRLKSQEEAVQHIMKVVEDANRKAEILYKRFPEIDSILQQTRAGAKQMGWAKVKKQLESTDKALSALVKSVNLKDKTMTLDLGEKITIFIEKSVPENANIFYEKAKRAKAKIPGLEKAMGETQGKVSSASDELDRAETKRVKTVKRAIERKHWYDTFRHFYSSEGFLCVAAQDATRNEILVKKHVEPEDVVFHSSTPGSPFAVVKTEGKKPGRATLDECAQFVAAYSKLWKGGAGSMDVFWVNPNQVTKTTKSGEFMGKGSFMVYGKKNQMKAVLQIAIGFKKDRIIAGPVDAVASKTPKYVILAPGGTKPAELARKIRPELFKQCSKIEQEILRKLSIDEIQRYIPAGKSDMLKRR